MDNAKETFNHEKAGVSDKIALIGELEHVQRHALRSAVSLYKEDEPEESRWLHYAIIAKEAKEMRRKIQNKYFGELSQYDWCLCKSAACLRQIAYEVIPSDTKELKEIDDLVDNIWGDALHMDLSDCEACRDDKNAVE